MGKTRGVHETTPEIRNRMVGMYEAGLGLRDIAAAVNCSQRTVKRWLNRFNKEGTVETRERCGRKRATTTEEDDAIIRLATQTPITAAKAVLPALGLSCSVDTIRERLHKAGIHNWSPSRKHMQRITIGDSATIQKAVWRPTGTQLGKKKLATKDSNGKSKRATASGAKKKTRPLKIRARDVYVGDETPAENQKEPSDQESGIFVYEQPSVAQQETNFTQENDDMNVKNESLSNYQAGFGNTLGLVQPTQPQVYQHHHGLNIVQSWPLDLVQAGNHDFPQQGGTHPMDHEQHQSQHLQELHTQREREQHIQQPHENLEHHTHCMDTQVHQMISQEKISGASACQEERMHLNDCSNSSTSNDQSSDNEEYSKSDSKGSETETNSGESRKKKGGKAKGTLETSVELRNRMIGMSEAGLSTLSIALAINRSERTVKRWLERWNKEGNVQTKERKGRRRITTKEQDDAIIAMATQHPLTAAKHVAPALGLNCSVDTIRERLHKAGIHSWKLGKKQGKGNSVHTVHLWQPSGNRPNKTKLLSDKKKTSSEKKGAPSSGETKRTQRKKKSVEENESPEAKTIPPPPAMIPPPPTMQFHENVPMTSYVPGPEMMHPVHNLAAPSLVSSVNGPQIGSSVAASMQVMGPVMQQRPDCRMANPVIPPEPPNPSVAYPSCMISASNTHPTHMDQQDPLNYEPYIWSF